MQNLVFTQLSIPEVRQLFRDELENYFAHNGISIPQANNDEIGGIDLAVKITGKAKPTIYGLVHDRKIPHSKQGKQLYFSRKELTDWLKAGKRKTQAELALDAENFSPNKPKNKTTVATR
jgi:excisionase family DNA binding protein